MSIGVGFGFHSGYIFAQTRFGNDGEKAKELAKVGESKTRLRRGLEAGSIHLIFSTLAADSGYSATSL
jgi:hypothetical protein